MSKSDPCDPAGDPFGPPKVSTLVGCLHCQEIYESYLIEWRLEPDRHGQMCGWWCCPTPGCDGKGFGFDILPTDRDYEDERGGWVRCDDDEDFDDADLDDAELDLPDPPAPERPDESSGEDQIPW